MTEHGDWRDAAGLFSLQPGEESGTAVLRRLRDEWDGAGEEAARYAPLVRAAERYGVARQEWEALPRPLTNLDAVSFAQALATLDAARCGLEAAAVALACGERTGEGDGHG